jgi:hypothetical protein
MNEIPDLDSYCGNHFTFRDLIECGETYLSKRPQNLPAETTTYDALRHLAETILEPVISKFEHIELTYGFSSPSLSKMIKHGTGRIFPLVDQHASCELSSSGNLICKRQGAAVDFLVQSHSMVTVAKWIAENCPFDRMYIYGDDRPLHVSHGPDHKREVVLMKPKKVSPGRFPSVINLTKLQGFNWATDGW